MSISGIPQHSDNSSFYRLIYSISKEKVINNIVDIGSHSGLGSTRMAIDGLNSAGKNEVDVYGIELNYELYSMSLNNLFNKYNSDHLHMLNGSIVTYTEMEPYVNNFEWDNNCNIDNTNTALQWLKRDIELIKNGKNILNDIPLKIDLLIIDGGEFCGFIEFQKLYKRSKYIILDDINSFKNKKSREYVLNNTEEFKIIMDLPEENCFGCKNLNFDNK